MANDPIKQMMSMKKLNCKVLSFDKSEEDCQNMLNEWLDANKEKEIVEMITVKYFLIIFYTK